MLQAPKLAELTPPKNYWVSGQTSNPAGFQTCNVIVHDKHLSSLLTNQDMRHRSVNSEQLGQHEQLSKRHTYIHAYIHACMHTYIPTYLRTYLPTYLPTYIHTYVHRYVHTCSTVTHGIALPDGHCLWHCPCHSHVHGVTQIVGTSAQKYPHRECLNT